MLEFGMSQLKAVADRCNRRIAETGDYAAIVVGHTPDPGDEGAAQPELVGYAGPFRLGTIGEGERKCWAILADFHIFKNDLAKVRKHPRRSPELCLEDTYEEMFLDPIALLGAEAPRLDLGLLTGAQGGDGAALAAEMPAKRLYSFLKNGRQVEKYAMAACAMPSAGNVHVPNQSTQPAKKYAAAPQPSSETSMLTPEDISAVVEAFLSTDAGQFLVSEMKAKQGTNAIVEPAQEPPAETIEPATAEAQPAADTVPPPEPASEPKLSPASPGASDAPPAAPPAEKPPEELPKPNGDQDEASKKYSAACQHADGMNDEEMEKYLSNRWRDNPKWKKYGAAESASIEPEAKTPPKGEVTNKTGDPAGDGAAPPAEQLKPTQLYSRLQSEVQTLKGELAAERNERRKIERYSRLQGLSGEYIMDADEELATTAKMDDEQFERHISKTVREHYQRNPVGLPWAAPTKGKSADPSHPGNVVKPTSQKDVDKAVEKYQRKRAAGESVDFEQCLEDAKAGR